MSVSPIEASWGFQDPMNACGLWHTSILIGRAYRHCNFLPLQERRNLLDLAALLHLEELDISHDQCLEFPYKFHFSNADCRELAKLTALQTLHVSGNKPINDSGFKVGTSPLSGGLFPGSLVWTLFLPGLPLHSRHMRWCVNEVSSTLTMMLAAVKQPSQQITSVSLPWE